MEITTHVNLQTILCRLFVIPSNLSMKLPLELPFLEHHPPLFTDYLTISYRSVNFCNVSHFSGPAKRQSTLRQAWASPHQSPALRATPGTTRRGAAKKNLGGNLSVHIQWMNYCVWLWWIRSCMQALRCVGNVYPVPPIPFPCLCRHKCVRPIDGVV